MQGKFKMRSSGSKVTDTVFLDDEGNFISRNFTHALKTTKFLLQSDYNEGNFTWKLLYFFVCFSPYIRGIFLNLQTSFFRFMCYERCKFGCNQSLTKGTFLGEQSIFSFVHRLPFQGFNWNFEPPFFSRMSYTRWKFCYYRQKMKSNLPGEQSSFCLYLGFQYLAVTTHSLNTM